MTCRSSEPAKIGEILAREERFSRWRSLDALTASWLMM